jgi:2-haloacid dehalogenase
MNKYKLIIFDLDDTLFDYARTEKFALIKTCDRLGIKFIGDLYSQYKKANNIVRGDYNILTSNNIKQFRNSRAIKFFSLINNIEINPNDFIEVYLKYSTEGILIEGVQETLENLEGVLKVVATNGTNYPRQNKFENSQIAKYFDAYYSAENLGVAKPNSEFFLKIIKQFNVSKDEILNVGDDYSTDIQGAFELGIDGCWFNYRHNKCTIVLPSSVYVIGKFKELISIVKGE